jgi:cytochrome c-type biogenesis protein CcmH/NrfG
VEPTTVEKVLALLRERPDDAELYQQLGDLYFKQGELMEAWKAFMQSLRINPDDPWTCLKFGTLLTLCDDKKYARELFDHAIKLDPDLAVSHWCSGNLYRKQGDYELAESAYERAVEVDPDDEQARDKLTEWRSFIAGVRGTATPSAAEVPRTRRCT